MALEPRIKFWVSAKTQADLDQLHTSIESDLPPPNRIKGRLTDWLQYSQPPVHLFCATFDLVFTRIQDADAFWQKIVNKQAQIAAAVLAFRANYHQCTHGIDPEPVIVPCVGQDLRLGAGF